MKIPDQLKPYFDLENSTFNCPFCKTNKLIDRSAYWLSCTEKCVRLFINQHKEVIAASYSVDPKGKDYLIYQNYVISETTIYCSLGMDTTRNHINLPLVDLDFKDLKSQIETFLLFL
jgi:hypothetical protein